MNRPLSGAPRLLTVLLAIAASVPASYAAAAKPPDFAAWAGTYELHDSAENTVLRLEGDGTYSLEARSDLVGDPELDRSYGIFCVNQDLFVLVPTDLNRPLRHLSVPEELVPVIWGARRYLLYPEEVERFCRDVRTGDEPRGHDWGNYLLRTAELKMYPTCVPVLPRRFDRLLRGIHPVAKWKRFGPGPGYPVYMAAFASIALDRMDERTAAKYAGEAITRGTDNLTDYGEGVSQAYQVLGRIRLLHGDVAGAVRYLQLSGRTAPGDEHHGLPLDLNLADALLSRGQRQAVADFLLDVSRYYDGTPQLAAWRDEILAGRPVHLLNGLPPDS